MVPFPVFRQRIDNTTTLPYESALASRTVYSSPWSCGIYKGFSATVIFSAGVTGTLTLWTANKATPDLTTDADWVQLTVPTITNPAGSAIKNMYELSQVDGRWYRYKFISSGSVTAGTMGVWVSKA